VQPPQASPYGQTPAYGQPATPTYGPGQEPPLDQPWYGIGFGAAVKRFFKKYATFSGRASRGEYWWAYLGTAVPLNILAFIAFVPLIAGLLQDLNEYDPYSSYNSPDLSGTISGSAITIVLLLVVGVAGLALIVPGLAVTWRRLHDSGKSGALFFLVLIPSVGSIILLVLLALPSDPSGARYDVGAVPGGIY
jgi:uncharacterized membrane protein YhaH (DUF805 family)